MSINSRAKGARLERAVANDLRRWLGVECLPCSGGRMPPCSVCDDAGYVSDWTITRNETAYQCGLDGRAGEFHITGPGVHPLVWECKRDDGFDERQLFKRPLTGPLWKFWQQAVRQAGSVNHSGNGTGSALAPLVFRHPILVCQRTRGPRVAFIRRNTSNRLTQSAMGRPRPIMHVEVGRDTLDGDDLAVWLWSDLMAVSSLRLAELTL